MHAFILIKQMYVIDDPEFYGHSEIFASYGCGIRA